MRLYTHATPSHHELLNGWLLPTASAEFDVIVGTSEQHGSGRYDDQDWGKNTHQKSRTMLRAVTENIGDVVVWSDCDVQILRPCRDRLLELLGDHDIAASRNDKGGGLCSGFYVVRCTPETASFFDGIVNSDVFEEGRRPKSSLTDQHVFNQNIATLDYVVLPGNEFWCNRFPLDVQNIRVHHANWIIGVPNKIAALKEVRRAVGAIDR